MISKKKNTTSKKIIRKTDEYIDVFEPVGDEARILGDTDKVTHVRYTNYEDPKRLYKVTNLQTKNSPVIIGGNLIETFIGTSNKQARIDLKSGIKKVITKDIDGNAIYKIEAIN